MNYRYTIKFSHFNYRYLHDLLNNLIFLINLLLSPKFISLVDLPNKKKTKTILRSPHIFKKSREQFSKIIYNKLLILKFNKNYTTILKSFLSTLNCTYKLNIFYER